jgi:hypothetical protein
VEDRRKGQVEEIEAGRWKRGKSQLRMKEKQMTVGREVKDW